MQVPAPSQAPIGLLVDPVQLAVPQLVPALLFRQFPAPSQVPLNPQGGFAVQRACGSPLPAGTGWQEPAAPVRLHIWQVPQLGAEQQTPSTQLWLSHSVPAAQIWPSRFSPQEPALHTLGETQSLSALQTATQLWVVALQTNGAQGCVVAGLQTPAPSQVRASAAVPVSWHEGAAHCVPAV